jgi:pSer/pThr/pTyr-binding forkhead associated (FHA) protein
MARLQITSPGFHDRVLELRLGTNRLGRSPANDFQIDHPTISGKHCEIVLSETELILRDCNSTNGTFIDEAPVTEASLGVGQKLRFGDVELVVENTDVFVAIPKFEVQRPAPPVVLTDGSLICPRHRHAKATYQCTHCREVMCDDCIHLLHRRGGKVLKLCPLCSHKCVRIGGEKQKKKTFLGFLQKTVKLPFLRTRVEDED